MKKIVIKVEGEAATLIIDGIEMKGVSEFSIQKIGHDPVELLVKGSVTELIQVSS